MGYYCDPCKLNQLLLLHFYLYQTIQMFCLHLHTHYSFLRGSDNHPQLSHFECSESRYYHLVLCLIVFRKGIETGVLPKLSFIFDVLFWAHYFLSIQHFLLFDFWSAHCFLMFSFLSFLNFIDWSFFLSSFCDDANIIFRSRYYYFIIYPNYDYN